MACAFTFELSLQHANVNFAHFVHDGDKTLITVFQA
jgi:hypothetical protein